MRIRVRRVLAISAIAVVGLAAIGLLILHTSTVQSRILNWSIAELERRFDLDLKADDLHYNLATRRVTMTNVRLAAKGHGDSPFFVADRVGVHLPWVVFRGRLRFERIDVGNSRVTVTRDARGVSNLPPGRGRRDPNAPPRRIDVRNLSVRHLDFTYYDYQRDIEIRAPGVKTDLEYVLADGAKGPFAVTAPMLIRIRERRVTAEPITGGVVFDAMNLALENVQLRTSEGDMRVDGGITRVLDQPTLDLRLDGTANIAQAARWTAPPIHLSGAARIKGTMKGAPSEFVLDTHVSAADAEIGHERGVRIEADSRLTMDGVAVSESTIRPATGGEIHATVDVPFGDAAAWWIKANWRGLDAATGFRLAEVRPLPFGAAMTGSLRLDKAAGTEPFRLEVHNTSVARESRGTAPTSGEVEFFISGSRWRADQRHRVGATLVSGSIGGVWNRRAASRSTIAGDLIVNSSDLADAARVAALFGLDTPDIVRDTRGPIDANVRVEGEFTEPRFIGTAKSAGVTLPSIGRTAFTADFDASERALDVTNIAASIGSARMTGEVFANFVSRSLAGALKINAPSARDLLTAVPENMRLDGPLTATATIAGTVDEPDVTAVVTGQALTLAGQPLDKLTANLRLLDDGVDIQSVTVTQGPGTLTAKGRYSWTTRSYVVDLAGDGITWRGALGGLGNAAARFSVKFNGAGSIDRPAGEGVVEFDVTGGVAGDLVGRGIANVRLNGETALVAARIPSLGAFIDAKIQPREPFLYDAIAVVNRVDLAQLAPLLGARPGYLAGTASLSATASGTLRNPRASRAFINLQDVAAKVESVDVALAAPSRLSWDGTGLTVDTLDLTVGGGRLLASGYLGESGVAGARWESTFKGELADLVTVGRPFGIPDELAATGPVDFVWRSTGGIEQSAATLQLTGGTLTWAKLPTVVDLNINAGFDGRTLEVTRLTGLWQGGGIEGSASIPRAVLEARSPQAPAPAQPGFAKLRVVGLTAAAFEPWVSASTLARLEGRLSATLDVQIPRPALDAVIGRVTLDEADLTVAGVRVNQTRPSVLSINGGVITAEDVVWNAGGAPLTLTGTARIAPTDKQTLDFDVRGTADLEILAAFAPTVAIDGTAKVDVGIGGTPEEPVFSGRIDVANGEIAIREPRVVLSDLAGTLALDGRRLLFDSFTGTLNGGTLLLDGGFLLTGSDITGGVLSMQVQRAALEYPEGLQSEANALLVLRPTLGRFTLSGDIIVARSVYNEAISFAELIAARQSAAPIAGGESEWRRELALSINVTTQEDLRVDNNYGRLEAAADLRVVGTIAEPGLIGRVTLQEGGEVYLAGHTFHLTRGSISFANPNRIEPDFDVELRTLVSGSDLAVTLSGPLDRLETDVRSSDPNVSSREAMSALFGGFRGEDAVTLLSTELLGVTGRAIGLDTLRVQRGFDTEIFRADPGLVFEQTDPSTRLTLSKYLRPDVELILSQSLRESGGLSAIVSYRPKRNIEIRGISEDGRNRAIAIRHEITFGGAAGAASTEAPPQPEVSSITISGDPRKPPAEVLEKLSLDVGEEFDFHRWQRDLDDLREIYQDEGYYEARVRGTRVTDEAANTIALDYRIEPGPLAELVIDGHQFEPALQDDLREAWRRTIFDRFLLEDIETRIRRHLMDENIVGSEVKAAITVATPQRKQVRVTVRAGASVNDRDVRYTGAAAFREKELDAVIAAAALEVDGWLDPRRIAETIADYYRSEGYLGVNVKADQPRVEAGIGVLPVTIEEGMRFTLTAIRFPGAHQNRIVDAARAANLQYGDPYIAREVDDARRRVEDFYASRGFNDVDVELETVPVTDEGVIEVNFEVREGPQQVLRDVQSQGETRTSQDIIQRALRLRLGEPVNLQEWARARKRMYDTNVFRQVDIDAVPIEPTEDDKKNGIQPVRAVIRVAEYPTWRFRYGLQANDEQLETAEPDGDTRQQNLGVITELRNQNLLGWAITAGIAGRYEKDRQAGNLFVSNSSFFGLPVRNSGFIFASRQQFRVDGAVFSVNDRSGLSFEQRWRPFRDAEMFYSYRFERNTTALADPDPIVGDIATTINVSRLNAAMLIDRRDDPFEPARGWFSSATWEQSLRALGSTLANSKVLVQQLYFAEFGRFVLASRAQIGTAFGEEALTVEQRFTAGGGTTIRGYGENTLGPRSPFNAPVGGDGLVILNQEARFPVRGWVQGVAFLDAGNVYRGRVSFKDLKVGYGVGLRLDTPFVMVRLDYGIPLSVAAPGDQKKGRFYFGIGHIF